MNICCKDCELWKLYKDRCYYWWKDKKECTQKILMGDKL